MSMDIKKSKERVKKDIERLNLSKKIDDLRLKYLEQELKWIEDLENDSNYTNYIEEGIDKNGNR